MEKQAALIADPLIVFRQEFDDWAILFNPDTGDVFSLNPVSAFVWKHLDGKHTVDEIVKALRTECEDVPEEAGAHVTEFVEALLNKGLAGTEHIGA